MAQNTNPITNEVQIPWKLLMGGENGKIPWYLYLMDSLVRTNFDFVVKYHWISHVSFTAYFTS
jgi:hypothetical protein